MPIGIGERPAHMPAISFDDHALENSGNTRAYPPAHGVRKRTHLKSTPPLLLSWYRPGMPAPSRSFGSCCSTTASQSEEIEATWLRVLSGICLQSPQEAECVCCELANFLRFIQSAALGLSPSRPFSAPSTATAPRTGGGVPGTASIATPTTTYTCTTSWPSLV